MSKALRTVGMIAGAVALVATGVGAIAGAGTIIAGVGTAASIAAVSSTVATAASIGAAVTAKKPAMRGTASQVVIANNAPIPYTMGETYIGGNLIHDVGYGGKRNGVHNPFRTMVFIYSGAGPVEQVSQFYADFTAINFSGLEAIGYYKDYLDFVSQPGLTPEPSRLMVGSTPIPGWGTDAKLSGYAASLITMVFDKNGKKYASGVPQFGVVMKGVKAYDPRLDSTYPGGSGAHRIDNEATWTYTENPALHAVAYAYGRYQNGKKVMGIGIEADGIDLAADVEWANVCQANGWKLGGTIYEGPEISKWDNLKLICQAGGAEPVFSGALLSVKFNAPKIALDTITADDLADGEYVVPAMQTWRDRINTIIPRYRSSAHKWEYVQSDAISVPEYVAEDGEEKRREQQYTLVQSKDQAAQLAAYDMVNGREFGPITLPCKPRLLEYKLGEALTVNVPDLGLNGQLCVITGRSFNPATGIVDLTLVSETTAKHAFALGQTGTAPPTPIITAPEDLDEAAGDNGATQFNVEVTPTVNFQADYTGAVVAGSLPRTVSPSVTQGGVSVKALASYAVATAGVTATVDNTPSASTRGDISITAVDALDGYVDLSVSLAGQTTTKRIVISRRDGIASGFGGAGSKIASDNSFPNISSNIATALTDVLTVTLGAGETLYGTAPLSYDIVFTGFAATRALTAWWEYSSDGGTTWTAFGAGITGSAAQAAYNYEIAPGEPEYREGATGSGNFTQSVGGLASGDYKVRMMANASATGRSLVIYGAATIEAKV